MNDAPAHTSLAWLTVGACLLGLVFATVQVKQAPVLAAFDLNAAMNVAGGEVPEGLESFYFFVPEAGRSRHDEIAELTRLLGLAAAEKDHIGIAGADAARNREEFLAALEGITTGLNGATIVYLGPDEHRVEIQAATDRSGAQLKFVRYPPLPDNAI